MFCKIVNENKPTENNQLEEEEDEHLDQISITSENSSNTEEIIQQNKYKDLFAFLVNDKEYKIRFLQRDREGRDPETFTEKLLFNFPNIMSATIISLYYDRVDQTSIGMSVLGYIYGKKLLPVLLSIYTMKSVMLYNSSK